MILITGGTGFIGSHTAVELIAAGKQVVLLDNLINSEASVVAGIQKITGKTVPFIQADARDENTLKSVLTKYSIEAVIHFAALKAVPESFKRPIEYYDNNVNSLIQVLRQAAQHGVTRFVFSSSAAVYGAHAQSPIREDALPALENSPYGMTKIICEKILADNTRIQNEMKTVSLRYFNPVGAHDSGLIGELPQGVPNNLVPYLIQVAAGLREKLTVFGNDYATPDGTCVRDFVHVSDLARAHVAALTWLENKSNSAAPEFFNLGLGKGTSVLELIRIFEDVSGKKIAHEFGPRRIGDVAELFADATKANRELGWVPQHTITDAMQGAWKWARHLRESGL